MVELQFHRLAAHYIVILKFNSGESLAVHPSHPHHRRGQVALRIKPLIFAHRPDAIEAQIFHFMPALRRQMAREPHEGLAPLQLRR